jgi:hypothetical protein
MPREVNGCLVLYEEQGNLAFIYSNFRAGYLEFRSRFQGDIGLGKACVIVFSQNI